MKRSKQAGRGRARKGGKQPVSKTQVLIHADVLPKIHSIENGKVWLLPPHFVRPELDQDLKEEAANLTAGECLQLAAKLKRWTEQLEGTACALNLVVDYTNACTN